jgi:hypothetical protein
MILTLYMDAASINWHVVSNGKELQGVNKHYVTVTWNSHLSVSISHYGLDL